MDLSWALPVVAGSMATLGGQAAWHYWQRRTSQRPLGVSVHASFHPMHDCVCIDITNDGMVPVEITRVVAQFHTGRPRRRRRLAAGKFFIPIDLGWASMWPERFQGDNPSLILPGAYVPFTAGHADVAKFAADAHWLTVIVTLGEAGICRQSIDLDRTKRLWEANAIPPYVPKKGEMLIDSPNLSMVMPTYPPKWSPAKQIVSTSETEDD